MDKRTVTTATGEEVEGHVLADLGDGFTVMVLTDTTSRNADGSFAVRIVGVVGVTDDAEPTTETVSAEVSPLEPDYDPAIYNDESRSPVRWDADSARWVPNNLPDSEGPEQ